MHTARSADGTTIAFDRLGQGPPIVLVGGAFSYREFPKMVQLAELLAERFTVVNYDRRGRGNSGDTAPYAVEREIEDLRALIDSVGGSASLWGWSSGAVLALRAAASGLNVDKLAVYEPPFIVGDSGHLPPPDLATRLDAVVATGRSGDVVKLYMTKAMGIPPAFVAMMRISPFWSKLKATAFSTPYDLAIMGDTMAGNPLSAADWAGVTAPTLVMAGEKSPALLRDGAQAIADVLPNAHHRVLPCLSHNVNMRTLAPVLADFFAGEQSRPASGQAVQLAVA